MTDNDFADLLTIKQKLWQAIAALSTISSEDYRQRMRAADSYVRSALEHVERRIKEWGKEQEETEARRQAVGRSRQETPPELSSNNE